MRRLCMLPVLALAGCHIVFPIEPYGDDDPDGGNGTAPRVFSSPGPAAMLYGGYPKSYSITLAADQPGTTIYYTTDGSEPTTDSPTTMNSATPIKGITISTTTMVKFFGVQSGAQGMTTTEAQAIDATTAQINAGYLITNVTLDGNTPVVFAGKGDLLAARANVQTWVQNNCAACAAQVVFGVDDTDQGCVYDGGPGVYPGVTTAGKMFMVRAPMTVGVHEVRVAHIEQTNCATAMAAQALKTRPTLARLGVIVVR